PCAMIVDSSATSGRPAACAVAISGASTRFTPELSAIAPAPGSRFVTRPPAARHPATVLRRVVSSTTPLLLLAPVKPATPAPAYALRRGRVSWRAQEWASLEPGSLYNALNTLTRDGLLEVASPDQVGGRPERTTYRLTRSGDEEFRTLLREEWWTVRP